MKPLTTKLIAAADFTDEPKEFGRSADVQRCFGIKRGTLYNLWRDGKIRGVVLRVRGQKSGVRLWDMESIRQYIRSQMHEASTGELCG